jgi:hypothetical protein
MSKELAQYIKKQLKGCRVKGIDKNHLYLKEPLQDSLEFWIEQFTLRKSIGHSEWSERYQSNQWVDD